MTPEEIMGWQARERAFLATPIGAAFHKFKNACFIVGADEHREYVSTGTLRKHDDDMRAAEAALRDALAAQTDEVERLRSENAELRKVARLAADDRPHTALTRARELFAKLGGRV